ncbi:Baseplate J-like protein [compost metagenome]
MNRELATKARREGHFYGANQTLIDIPLGSRFSIENVSYAAISRISSGVYVLECEAAGNAGNQPFGVLLPIQYIAGLARAELGAVIVPGEEEEADDALRVRYYETVNRPSFGGNIADYKQKINAMDGIGGVKVFPAWQGGGTVKCTIITSDWSEPSPLLVSEVQTAVDPTVNSGQGLGTAPIGHQVTIAGVLGVPVHVATTVTLADGVTASQVQERIENVIDSYLADLRHSWADQEQLIVRVSLIEAAILTVTGVIDVQDTTLNLQAANITLPAEEIPVLGTVTLDV